MLYKLYRGIIFLISILAVWGGFYTRSSAFEIDFSDEYVIETLYDRADDIDLLARVIDCECGDDWCEDELLYLTGAVIINRVDDDRFPDNIRDVVYAPGQYSTSSHFYDRKMPRKRAWRTAVWLVLYGCEDTPPDMVFQANFGQGRQLYKKIQGVYICCG